MLFYNKERLKESAERAVAAGNLSKALAVYHKILSREPEEKDVLCMMAELMIQTGDQAEGLKCLKRAASAFHAGGENLKAVTVYRKYLKYDETDDEIIAAMTEVFLKDNKTKEAAEVLSRASQLQDKLNPSKSIYYLEKLLKILPDNLDAMAALCAHYTRQKMHAKAREFNFTVGKKLFQKGDYSRSYLLLYDVLQQDPENREVNVMVLETLIKLKSYDDALVHLNSMKLAEADSDPTMLTYKAEILFELGRKEEILPVLHKLSLISPKGFETLFRFAEHSIARKNSDLSLDILNIVDYSHYLEFGSKMTELLNRILSENENNTAAMQKLVEYKVFIGDVYGVQSLYSKLYGMYIKGNERKKAYQLLGKWVQVDEENDWIRKEMRRLKMQLEEESYGRSDLIRGKLEEIGLGDVIQMLESARKTGVLHILFTDMEGKIYFRDGGMIHAHFKQMEGQGALVSLFKLTGGDFMFDPRLPALEKTTISGSNTHVVLDALRVIDEEAHHAAEGASAEK